MKKTIIAILTLLSFSQAFAYNGKIEFKNIKQVGHFDGYTDASKNKIQGTDLYESSVILKDINTSFKITFAVSGSEISYVQIGQAYQQGEQTINEINSLNKILEKYKTNTNNLIPIIKKELQNSIKTKK